MGALDRIQWFAVTNTEAEAIPAFALVQVQGVEDDGTLSVGFPATDGALDVLVNGPTDIPEGESGQAYTAPFLSVLYDASDGDPVVDETWGAGAGVWWLKKGNAGFVAKDEGDGRALSVMPQVSASGKDVVGALPDELKVVGLRNRPLSSVAPTDGQVLTWLESALLPPVFDAPALEAGGALVDGVSVYYVITSVDEVGETTPSAEVTATPAGADLSVVLAWTEAADASGYRIYRSTASGTYGATSLLASIDDGDTVAFTDAGLTLTTGTPPASNTAGEWKAQTASGSITVADISGIPSFPGSSIVWIDTTGGLTLVDYGGEPMIGLPYATTAAAGSISTSNAQRMVGKHWSGQSVFEVPGDGVQAPLAHHLEFKTDLFDAGDFASSGSGDNAIYSVLRTGRASGTTLRGVLKITTGNCRMGAVDDTGTVYGQTNFQVQDNTGTIHGGAWNLDLSGNGFAGGLYVGGTVVASVGGGTTGLTFTGTTSLTLGGTLVPANGGSGVASPAAHSLLIAQGAAPMTPVALTDGQVLIGSTGADPVAGSLTPGPGTKVTGGAGSIQVDHYDAFTTDSYGATVTFDLGTNDRHVVTLTGNPMLALTGDSDGQGFSIVLQQDATGGRTVTWWGGIKWSGGSPPTLTSAANAIDVCSFIRLSAGTYLGFYSLNFA